MRKFTIRLSKGFEKIKRHADEGRVPFCVKNILWLKLCFFPDLFKAYLKGVAFGFNVGGSAGKIVEGQIGVQVCYPFKLNAQAAFRQVQAFEYR